MSCGFAAVEQSGPSQEHCPRADRADPSNASSHLSNPPHYFNPHLIVLNCTATGYEQGVDLSADPPKRVMRGDLQSTVRNNGRAGRSGYYFNGIDWKRPGVLFAEHLRGTSKNLKWSDQIQDLGPGPSNEQHPSCARLNLLLII
jgi:hypothetical protein